MKETLKNAVNYASFSDYILIHLVVKMSLPDEGLCFQIRRLIGESPLD